VESFAGFIFGCFDPEGPSLREYLGDMAWYMESFTERSDVELIGPPIKLILKCFIGDSYHVGLVHAAVLSVLGGPLAAMSGNMMAPPEMGIEVSTRYGHGFGILWDIAAGLHRSNDYTEFLKTKHAEPVAKVGELRGRLYRSHWDASIFPNCSFLYGTGSWKMLHLRGRHECEVWTWALVEKDMPVELKRKIQRQTLRMFGTAGTFESEDGLALHGCTYTNQGAVRRRGEMNGSMGLAEESTSPDMPGVISKSNWSEVALRVFIVFMQRCLRRATGLRSLREPRPTRMPRLQGSRFFLRRFAQIRTPERGLSYGISGQPRALLRRSAVLFPRSASLH
jgi:hypothetical protein